MKVLAVNCGSSTLRFHLIDMGSGGTAAEREHRLAHGIVDRIGGRGTMEFIGENGVSAPTLKEESPRNPKTMYKTLLSNIKKLYRRAKLVHGDLSEYNIMNDRGEPVIFDMGQSVLVEHPLARELLLRDLKNLNIYFSKLGVSIKEENYLSKWVTSI